MGVLKYIPDRGDIVGFDLGPTRGHEQKGHRPSLVITPKKFNVIHGNMVICPITRTFKNHPLEVKIDTIKVKGVVLPHQIRTIDWQARSVKYIGDAAHNTVQDVCYELELLIKGE